MAHVPGQVVALKDDAWGTDCENHSDRKAVKRICSEADSFGAEYMNFCQECWDNYQQGLKEKEEDPEQWDTCTECKKKASRLISYRDMDEGMHGPVYEHCGDCHSKMNARIAEEDAYYDNDGDDYYDSEPEDAYYDNDGDDYYDSEPECEYEPEPHYEDVIESELQVVADYLKREYRLPFVVTKSGRKTGESDLSIDLVITGNKAYRRFNKRFKSFIAKDIDNSLIDVKELKDAICGTADDLDTIILNRRTRDRKIEGSKLKLTPSFAELVKMAQERTRFKHKLSKEFITPVYSISIMLSKVYWS